MVIGYRTLQQNSVAIQPPIKAFFGVIAFQFDEFEDLVRLSDLFNASWASLTTPLVVKIRIGVDIA